jgi:hypothetical protein
MEDLNENSNILIYEDKNNNTKVEVKLADETLWLSLNQLSELFDIDKSGISRHIKNIFESYELEEKRTVAKIATVQFEGNREIKREIEYYNLDMIISVGYRINSIRGTKFRIWATNKLKEYLVKGFILDDERLKTGKNKYFDELLERIREIRTSERNFYQKITDIYSTSIDYDKNSQKTRDFFATVQNKLHYFITRKTATELIYERVNSKKHLMGLTSFKGKKISSYDIKIAKNYLDEKELKSLNLIVDSYLSFAEFQAQREKQMTMEDWIKKLDDFIKLSGGEILENAGKISRKFAEEKAKEEFKKYREDEDKNFVSDFDREVKKYLENNKNGGKS